MLMYTCAHVKYVCVVKFVLSSITSKNLKCKQVPCELNRIVVDSD